MCLSRDQLLAQNFGAVLAVIVKLAGDTTLAKFCQDALSHILRHPRRIQTQDVVGIGWNRLVWVQMRGDGDWLRWGFGISWIGENGCSDRCWER